jgi:hypothetical protein
LLLSFVLGQHKKENDDERLLVLIFCGTMQRKRKLTKGGKVQNVLGDIDDGDGVMELTLEQAKVMAKQNSHWNEQ